MGMVTFVEETTSGVGGGAGAWALDIAEARLTLREVIRRRVFHEVAQDKEGADPERQFERALTAFGRNGFVVLVGERQVEELDEEIELPAGTEVTFLKLVPLVGG
ncbi:hypothetical protein [Streptomyces sp. NBC_01465]|uniref:hypothetical protein n=1 Tax=Streptomyces sp. NBC_01465 TaxID=2903878 RepID=UPI002E36AD81|nr:hypothetical protein [Streptomyces sp. NBC_01465]